MRGRSDDAAKRGPPVLMTVIGALLPVIVTLLIGVVAAWHHDFDAKQATVLNRMVMLYALPMLLFSGMVAIPRDQLTGDASLAAVIVIAMTLPPARSSWRHPSQRGRS